MICRIFYIPRSFIFAAMFRQLISVMFILAFVVQTFHKPFIVLDYYANTAAFAKNCVNKAKPKMHCNGKCQMMKKLQEEEKKEQKDQERKESNKTDVLSSRSFFYSFASVFNKQNINNYSITGGGKPIEMPRSFFHPPCA